MALAEASFYADRLAQTELELGELKSTFHKYKLKQKVKLDQLRKEVTAYCTENGTTTNVKENNALLLIQVAEAETALERAMEQNDLLNDEIAKKQTQLNDHMILIKNLEERLAAVAPLSEAEKTERKLMAQNIDMERIQQQILYKDERIVELNNIILDKERQILDLQEACREQGEVASAKNQAMRIVQKRFEELETRTHREVGTETDSWLWKEKERPSGRSGRSSSPGHAVVSRTQAVVVTSGSPPPPEPQDLEGRVLNRDEEDEPSTSALFQGKEIDHDGSLRKKNRKRVTFDLPLSPGASASEAYQLLSAEATRLSDENSRLRMELEASNAIVSSGDLRFNELESEMARMVRDGKNASLKARAVAQARIRELEDSLAASNHDHLVQVEKLQIENETLRNTREWEVERNGRLRDEIGALRDKISRLTDELDTSEKSNRDHESRIEELEKQREELFEELADAEELVVFMEEQKHDILDDVDRLKAAITAQDELIAVLEADIVIYEEHIGILRESLGASKVDHRSLIRSKAFETKLKALEQEKEQIKSKSREDGLRVKTLSDKVKMLEELNERLTAQLCEKDMHAQDDEDLSDTCKLLEERLKKAEERMNEERSDYEVRLETAFIELERKKREVEDLTSKIHDIKLSSTRSSLERQEPLPEQSVVNQPQEQIEALLAEVARLSNQAGDQLEQLEHANLQISNLNGQVDSLQCQNFELQGQLKNLQEIEEQFDLLVERHRETSQELVNAQEKVEALSGQIESIKQVAEENQEKLAEADKHRSSLQFENDNLKIAIRETEALKVELKHLQDELDAYKKDGRAKFDELLRKLNEQDTGSQDSSRKNSVEIQREQYILAFEEKIDALTVELTDARAKIEQDKQEKKKLKAAVKQLKASLETQKADHELEPQIHVEHVIHQRAPPSSTAEVEVQVEPEASFQEEPNHSACQKTEQELLLKIHDLELECRLAGELSVEMGRVIQEFEEDAKQEYARKSAIENEAHAAKMELRLHEMIEEEIGHELDEMRSSQVDLNNRLQQLHTSLGEKCEELEQMKLALNSESTKVAELENELQNAKSEVSELQSCLADNELLAIELNELKQKISDSEIKENEYVEQIENLKRELAYRNVSQHSLSTSERPVIQEQVQNQMNSQSLESENVILRQCVHETEQLREVMCEDVTKLYELKNELETTVDALKAEIWSLNGLLKASVLDRENLQDRVVELDTTLAEQKRRADALDTELSEQVELTDKATRQAAEAENESNRRLAECLEMENRREALEKAYVQLTEYYNQLQTAYNALYSQLHGGEKVEETTQASSCAPQADMIELAAIIDAVIAELGIDLKPDSSISSKLYAIQTAVKEKLREVESLRTAVEEQQKLKSALQERLEALEDTAEADAGQALRLKDRLSQLEADLEWKQDECESLQKRMDELQRALDAVAERADEQDAARLATRQADVDSLFRTNAELAHTNVRLQNEIEELQDGEDDEPEEVSRDELVEQIRTLRDDKKALEDRVQQATSMELSLLDEIDKLKENVKEMTEKASETNNLKQEIVILNEKLESLEERIQQATSTELSLLAEIDTLKQELETTTDNSHKAEENEALRRDLQNLQDLLNAEKETTNDEISRLSSIEKILNTRILSLEDQLLEKEELIQELQENILESSSKISMKPSEEPPVEQAEVQHSFAPDEDSWGWGDEEGQSSTKMNPEPSANQNQGLAAALESANAELSIVQLQLRKLEKWKNDHVCEPDDGEGEVLEELQKDLEKTKKAKAALEKKLAEKSEMVQNLKEELNSVKKEANEVFSNQADLKVQAEESKSTVKSMRQEIENLFEELKKSESRSKELYEELEALKLATEDNQKSADNCEISITQDSQEGWNEDWDEKEENQETADQLKSKISGLESELLQEREKVQHLTVEIERLTELEGRCERMQTSIDELDSSQALSSTLILQLQGVIAEKEQLETELRAKISELESQTSKERESEWNDGWGEEEEQPTTSQNKENDEVKQLIVDNTELERLLDEQRTKLQSLLDDRSAEKEKLSELEFINGNLERQLDSLVAEKEAFEGQISEKMEEIEHLREEIIDLNNQLLAAREPLQQASSSGEWNEGWGESSEENAELQQEMEQLKSHESELEQLLNEERGKVDKMKCLVATLEEEASELRDESEARMLTIEELRAECAHLAQTMDSMNNKSEEFLQMSSDHKELLAQREEELNVVKKRLEELLQQNSLLKDSESRLLESVDEFAEAAEKNGAEASRLQGVVNKLEQQLADESEETSQLLLKVEELQRRCEENAANQATGNELPVLEKRVEVLSKERNLLQANIAELQEKLSAVTQERLKFKSAYEQLRAKVAHRRAQNSRPPSVASSTTSEIREEQLSFAQASLVPLPSTSRSGDTHQCVLGIEDQEEPCLIELTEFLDIVSFHLNAQEAQLDTLQQITDQIMGRKTVLKANSLPSVLSHTIDDGNSNEMMLKSEDMNEAKNTLSSGSGEHPHPLRESDATVAEHGDTAEAGLNTDDGIVISSEEVKFVRSVLDALKSGNVDELVEMDCVGEAVSLPILQELILMAENLARYYSSSVGQLKETESELNSQRLKFEDLDRKRSQEILDANQRLQELQSECDHISALLEKEQRVRVDLQEDFTRQIIDAENRLCQAETRHDEHLVSCKNDINSMQQQLLDVTQDAEFLRVEKEFVHTTKKQLEEELENLRLVMKTREEDIIQERQEVELEARNRVKIAEEELSSVRQKVILLEEDFEALRDEHAKGELELQRRNSELEQILTQMEAMVQEIVALQTEKEQAEAVEHCEKRKSSELEEEITLLRTEMKELEFIRNTLEKQAREKEEIVHELEVSLDSHTEELSRKEHERCSLHESLKECEVRYDNLQSELQILKENMASEAESYHRKELELANEMDRLKSCSSDEKHSLECELEMVKSRNALLEVELSRRDKKEEAERAQSSQESLAMKNVVNELESKNSQLEIDLQITKRNMEMAEAQYTTQLTSIEEENRRLRTDVGRFLQELDEAQEVIRTNEGNNQRILELERKISVIQSENSEKIVQVNEELREAHEREIQSGLQLSSASMEILNLRSLVALWQERFEATSVELETLRTRDEKQLESLLQSNSVAAIPEKCIESELQNDSQSDQPSAGVAVASGELDDGSIDSDFQDVSLLEEVHIDVEGSDLPNNPRSPSPSDYDFLSGSTLGQNIIRATAPYTPVLARFWRRIRHLQHRRALYPYFRYIFVAYMFVAHLIILHCWFM